MRRWKVYLTVAGADGHACVYLDALTWDDARLFAEALYADFDPCVEEDEVRE